MGILIPSNQYSTTSNYSQVPSKVGKMVSSSSPYSKIHCFFPTDPFFDFEALRILATCPAGGCEPAEFVTAIAAIKPGDQHSWNTAWAHASSLAESIAEEALSRGDVISARDAFLRASSYARASGYMITNGPTLQEHDPRSLPLARRTQSLFRKAIPFLDCEVKILNIPYVDERFGDREILLPAYLYIPAVQNRLENVKIPVLINSPGADSVQEELYFTHPHGGLQRGYAVLTFEGPGQGMPLRETGALMRPDWEVVTSRVIDYLEGFAEKLESEEGIALDMQKIAVTGASMGGYYAIRAASDARVKACISVDPFYDMWDFCTKHLSGFFMGAWMNGWIGDGIVDRAIWTGMRTSFKTNWEVSLTVSFFGIVSPAGILKEMKKYTFKDRFLERIKCPVLVTDAEHSIYFDTEDHTMRIYRELPGDSKRLWLASTPEEGGLQAKVGAFGLANNKVFGFLDEIFDIKRVI